MVLDSVEYQKMQVKSEFLKMIEIMQLYFKLDSIHDFKLDLQIYPQDKYETEPRIWLSAPNNHLGINLMLYSVKLSDCDGKVPNERAVEVFSEYMSFYQANEDLFELWHDKKDNWKPTASITFEISNRGR